MPKDYNKIVSDIKNKVYYPLYLLYGEEPYFINSICTLIEDSILTEEEKDFNQTVLYGNDVDCRAIIEYSKRFPMMASHNVVIVKEAQNISNIDLLLPYFEKPLNSTILVICYKYKKIDKRKSLPKVADKNGVLFESTKINESKIADWITEVVKQKGLSISPTAAALMSEFIGQDLLRIVKEIEKISLNIEKNIQINDKIIEEYIGISKDFSVFELQNALAKKDVVRANQLINYFASNTKENPIIKTIVILYNYFIKLIIYHSLKDKSRESVSAILGINPYFVRDYELLAKNYSPQKAQEIIEILHQFDLKSKGINTSSTSENDLYKEMIYMILH